MRTEIPNVKFYSLTKTILDSILISSVTDLEFLEYKKLKHLKEIR
jgi:hypothetical protein